METEIELKTVINPFREHWWKILISALVLALLLASYATFFISKKYQSKFSLIITNFNKDSDYVQSGAMGAIDTITSQYQTMSLADDLVDEMCKYMSDYLGYTNITSKAVKSSINVVSDSSRGLLTYTVTTTNPELSYDIAKAAEDTLNNYFNDQYYMAPTHIIDHATISSSPSSPNVPLYFVIGFVGGAFFAWLFYFIRSIIDTSVVNKKDIASQFKQPVIGEIPKW